MSEKKKNQCEIRVLKGLISQYKSSKSNFTNNDVTNLFNQEQKALEKGLWALNTIRKLEKVLSEEFWFFDDIPIYEVLELIKEKPDKKS